MDAIKILCAFRNNKINIINNQNNQNNQTNSIQNNWIIDDNIKVKKNINNKKCDEIRNIISNI